LLAADSLTRKTADLAHEDRAREIDLDAPCALIKTLDWPFAFERDLADPLAERETKTVVDPVAFERETAAPAARIASADVDVA